MGRSCSAGAGGKEQVMATKTGKTVEDDEKLSSRFVGHPVPEAALVMALGIVVERVSRLSDDDKRDLMEIAKSIVDVKSKDEMEEFCRSLYEILDDGLGTAAVARVEDEDGERPFGMFVGKRIRELRAAKGLTQQELARRADLEQSHISRLERGEYSPSAMTVAKLAKAMGVGVSEIDPN